MNEKAIFEIGDIISVRYKSKWGFYNRQKLTPKEITESVEYKHFKENNPELCRIAEER